MTLLQVPTPSNREPAGADSTVKWIVQKIQEIERKKDEYDHLLVTLNWMLNYRRLLDEDPQKAEAMMEQLRLRMNF